MFGSALEQVDGNYVACSDGVYGEVNDWPGVVVYDSISAGNNVVAC